MISLTSPVRTRAHGWPAGLKLGLLVAATVLLAAQDALAFHLCALAGTLGLYLLPGGRFFRAGLRALRGLWPVALIVLAWDGLTGDPLGGVVVVLRMVSAVALANLVTMTTRLSDMMEVVHWLGRPLARLGLNLRALEICLALVIRSIPALSEKAGLLRRSWQARAHRAPRWRLIPPLTLLALDDADHVAEALKARGGVAGPKTTKLP
ncbi:energy-coupling factor transporter transmembrane protein EcfT [Pseudooceanicola sp. CBS1P-1]|uniref:Energy-coupling factor transporter transmembrane protein EcfT n=1 Tax=Pseudooceanicola albus TaxID=2692189 RepID=A0A6L7G6L0_9RHOB|nr:MULTISPECIES: energy-coupling factor transporter transmembrane component T [Pseudooceanicola]MBT9386010.1 energy-coupling factor transporter transmembrane protein EcfT [Pseudooceanicola endophyticus]MXN19569.1 energy-coupling factor transporter transmembrane protein EcfT [Pseudooceanicola albus]